MSPNPQHIAGTEAGHCPGGDCRQACGSRRHVDVRIDRDGADDRDVLDRDSVCPVVGVETAGQPDSRGYRVALDGDVFGAGSIEQEERVVDSDVGAVVDQQRRRSSCRAGAQPVVRARLTTAEPNRSDGREGGVRTEDARDVEPAAAVDEEAFGRVWKLIPVIREDAGDGGRSRPPRVKSPKLVTSVGAFTGPRSATPTKAAVLVLTPSIGLLPEGTSSR